MDNNWLLGNNGKYGIKVSSIDDKKKDEIFMSQWIRLGICFGVAIDLH